MTKMKAPRAAVRAKAAASAGKPAPAATTTRECVLERPPGSLGKTREQLMAKVAADGVVGNACSLLTFGHRTFGDLSLTDCATVLKETAQGMNDGDLSAAVTMLSSQAVALNAMFGEFARRAALNMNEHLEATDRYMRLALKAQSQSRATLETLAAIKNPPVVFARQANINHGGQQQVNNRATPAHASNPAQSCAGARPGESTSGPNELLEDCTHGRTQLDTRAKAAAGRTNQGLEPVEAFDRTANR